MTKPIIVLGAGRHAIAVLDTLLEQGANVLGLTDPDVTKHGQILLGVPILGDDDYVRKFSPSEVELVSGVGSVTLPGLHRRIFERLKGQGYKFRSVVHESAVVSSRAVIGEGVHILAGAVICAAVTLGDNVIINVKANVSSETVIGAHSHIAPGAIISGGVNIGSACHIGSGAAVLQNLTLENDVLVGAGAVVTRNLAAHGVYVGVPARKLA